MRTLVVGLGQTGAGLHIPVLSRARAAGNQLFSSEPVVACDPRQLAGRRAGLIVTTTLVEAAALLDPDDTVAHVCTPPNVRTEVITELAELGFHDIVVDNPLAADNDDLARIMRLQRRHGLHIQVVEPWLASTLTARLTGLVRGGSMGEPRSITIVQNKPRFRRSLTAAGNLTAFDVELPHGVGLALRLAGNARVTHASGFDLEIGHMVVPRMGGARIGLRHNSGTRTEIVSDLTSPVRERRITIRFAHGVATGHYAVSDDDHHAQLVVEHGGHTERVVLHDDCLAGWLVQAYRDFYGRTGHGFDFAAEVAQVLSVGKNISAEPVVRTG